MWFACILIGLYLLCSFKIDSFALFPLRWWSARKQQNQTIQFTPKHWWSEVFIFFVCNLSLTSLNELFFIQLCCIYIEHYFDPLRSRHNCHYDIFSFNRDKHVDIFFIWKCINIFFCIWIEFQLNTCNYFEIIVFTLLSCNKIF